MKNDEGAIEFGAVLIFFFLIALLSGGALFAATGMSYIKRSNATLDIKLKADTILHSIEKDMQGLTHYEYDDINNPLLENLKQKYKDYGLEFSDASSGYHLDFLSDDELNEKNLSEFLFNGGNAANFIAWRNANGLTTDKQKWREYLTDEGWQSVVTYGWLHKENAASFALRTVAANFKTANPESLFPIVNTFPLININMVDPAILKPLINRAEYKIKEPDKKLETLTSRLAAGPLVSGDISGILNVPVNHPIMRCLGTRTAFWKLYLALDGASHAEAIVAAIPKKGAAAQEIAEYRIIDRRFTDD